MLGVEVDRHGADTNRAPIQIQEQLGVANGGVRNRDVAGGNGSPGDAVDVITTETGSARARKVEEVGEEGRGSQNALIGKEETGQHGPREDGCDITEGTSQERSTEEEDGRLGESDASPQPTAAEHEQDLKKRQGAPATKPKHGDGAARVRNSEARSTRRLTLPAPASSFPARTHSELPSFYGSSSGHCVRTPCTPGRRRAKNGGIKPASERPMSLDRRGGRHILKTEPRRMTGPHPKLTSPDWWGSLPRKTKTTKTFVWGPWGPQETKSVCELHTRTSKWKGLDRCQGLGEHGPAKLLALS